MRSAFIKALTELAEANSRILLITGDLGFGVLDHFQEHLPDQFYNFGVAEQNLAGVGAGLALSGHTVFTYSIGSFPTLRCLEQIRNDICYNGADVKIVAVGGGMAYGALGQSHFATEDLAIMRALPEMMVIAPGDPIEVKLLLPQIAAQPGPVYLRLGRANEPIIHSDDADVVLGKVSIVREGADVLLLSTGGMLAIAMESANILSQESIESKVVSVHTLSPLDSKAITDMASSFPVVITCEEHIITGGLGGAVAEVLAESGVRITFRRLGLPLTFPEGIGSQEYLRSINGIDAESLCAMVRSCLSNDSILPAS